tara:strand:- start:149 stop:433 length:285 start_codon:yes stop_codon:yes gene_type:complete
MFRMIKKNNLTWIVLKDDVQVFKGTRKDCFKFMNNDGRTELSDEAKMFDYIHTTTDEIVTTPNGKQYPDEGDLEYNFRLKTYQERRLNSIWRKQ